MTLLEAALEFLSHGYPVFPVHPRGKRPLTLHGYKDATRVKLHVESWWKKWPEANIGVPTGPGTWDVLDIDGEQGRASLEALNIELDCPIAQTPRGGLHGCYEGGTLSTAAGRLPGIDFRSAGGYVVVPPSIGENGNPYEWLVSPWQFGPLPKPPDALRELAYQRPAIRDVGSVKVDIADPGLKALLRMAEIPLYELTEGNRNETLFRFGASLRARASEQHEILFLLSAADAVLCKPPLGEAEIKKIVGSASRLSISPAYQRQQEIIQKAEAKARHAQERAEEATTKAKARAELAAEKANEVVDEATKKASEIIEDAALAATVEAQKDSPIVLRSILAKHVGLPIKRVLQIGRDAPNYYLDLGDAEPIMIGKSILNREVLADACIRQRQSTGFADLSPKRWQAVRSALVALIEVRDDVELERSGQTISWLRDFHQGELASGRLKKSEETVRKGLPFVQEKDGEQWLYVATKGLRLWLARAGINLTEHEIGGRLAEIGTRPGKHGIVSHSSPSGTVQCRYWHLPVSVL